LIKRIEKISSYIEDNEKVIDVGCDQAHLSELLAKRKIYSVASDIRKNIIDRAEKRINEDLKKYITFRVGNGVTLTEKETDYTLVLAGMGTHLILNIITESIVTFKKIITISNNNHEILRKEMNKKGYIIELEEIIKEKGKYYNIIIFKKGTKNYTEEEFIIGINHQNTLLLKDHNQYLIRKYKNILEKIKEAPKRKNIENKIKILESGI
jgi:tRNA (adenine22-N1)-methyltransferase